MLPDINLAARSPPPFPVVSDTLCKGITFLLTAQTHRRKTRKEEEGVGRRKRR